MAPNLLKIKFMVASLVVFHLLLVASSSSSSSARFAIKASESEIEYICSKAIKPGYCLTFLKSKPEAAKADVPGLAKLIIDSARQSATETLRQIDSFREKAPDRHSRLVYTSCSVNYGMAISCLDDALKSLAAGDGEALNMNASGAMDEAKLSKEDLFNVSPDPSTLIKEMEDFFNVCSIIIVLSNMLPPKLRIIP